MTTHVPKELQDPLIVGIDFPDLGMYKIEADHPMPSLNNLIVILEERYSSRFDVPVSLKQEYVEEITIAEYIQSILIAPAMEPRTAMR